MKNWTRLLATITVSGIILSGCGTITTVKNIFTKPLAKRNSVRAEKYPVRGRNEVVEEDASVYAKNDTAAPVTAACHDPMSPAMKSQSGIHYDPVMFEQGAYRPDTLENMINSKGFDGISQQTFAEAGVTQMWM